MKKRHLTLKKFQQKVSQLFFVVLGALNNILKVYQNLTTRKVSFSRRPPAVLKITSDNKNYIFEDTGNIIEYV